MLATAKRSTLLLAGFLSLILGGVQAAPDIGTAVIPLARDEVWSGPMTYSTTYPPFGYVNGNLTEIANVNDFLTLYFPKLGATKAACYDPASVVVLTPNSTTKPSDIVAIFGTERPRLPVIIIACFSHELVPPPQSVIEAILIRVTYEYVPSPQPAPDKPSVSCSNTSQNVTTCRIDKPDVKHPTTTYYQVSLSPGDVISIDAGGCVQTGGIGLTWKRYVDPKGSNSDRLYWGDISFSSMSGAARLSDVINKDITVPSDVQWPNFLQLGYSDDDYGDNGYWGHDNGTGDQCKDVGPAWLTINIRRNASQNYEYNIDRPGNDLAYIRPPYASLTRCIEACLRQPKCVACSYKEGGKCYLKRSLSKPTIKAGFTSWRRN